MIDVLIARTMSKLALKNGSQRDCCSNGYLIWNMGLSQFRCASKQAEESLGFIKVVCLGVVRLGFFLWIWGGGGGVWLVVDEGSAWESKWKWVVEWIFVAF